MKTFYKSSELPHLWAHGLVTYAKCPSAESIRGDSYYSYTTVIGRRYEHKNVRCFLVNDTSYSVTTSSHQSAMRSAIPSATRVFHIGDIGQGCSLNLGTHKQTGSKLFDYAINQAAESAMRAAKARKQTSKEWQESRQAKWLEDARDISAFFGLRRKVDDSTIARLQASKERAAKAQAKADAEREARHAKEQQEEIAAWMRGESVYLPYSLPCYLRTESKEIVTSKGAHITYEAGKRTFEFAMKARAKGWHKNGAQFKIDSYALDAVNEAGIVAGCHRIAWTEIERFAKQEGWMA